MSGYSQDRRPYEVWAKTATQDVTAPDHVELKTLRGKVLMQDQSTVTLEAVDGLMDTKQQLLELRKDIYLQTTQGYEAWLNQAFVDMGKGTVTSDEHVDVKWADGKISADKMKISGGGEIVAFRRQRRDEYRQDAAGRRCGIRPCLVVEGCESAAGRQILKCEMIR